MNKTISISEDVKKRLDKYKPIGFSYTGLISKLLNEHEEKTRGE